MLHSLHEIVARFRILSLEFYLPVQNYGQFTLTLGIALGPMTLNITSLSTTILSRMRLGI